MCFFALASSFAQQSNMAAPPAPLSVTMDQAVQMAMDNNLGLRQTIVGNEARRRAAQTPWNVFIPSVDVSGTLGRLNNEPQPTVMGPFVIPASPQWVLSSSLGFTLNLNVSALGEIHQILQEYQAGAITVENARRQLDRDVRRAYFQILLAQEFMQLMQESLENANRQFLVAQANFLAGLVPEVNVLQAQVARENLRPQVDETENGYRTAMASFALLLGLPHGTEFSLAPLPGNIEFIVLDTHNLIARAAANRPEIEVMRRNIAVLQAQRQALMFNLYTPTLSLGYNMDPTFMGDPMNDSWFGNNMWQQRSGMFRITLAWRLNGLLPFTREGLALQAMNDGLTSMNLGMGQLVQGTQIEVHNTIMQLERIRTTIDAQRLTVDMAERTLQLTETAYQHGLVMLMQVQGDELALRQARVNLLQQMYNYLMLLLDLEYAIGVSFGTLGGGIH